MSRPKELLAKIEAEEAEGAIAYEYLSDGLKAELEASRYAPPEIVHRGLVAIKSFLDAF